MTGCVRRTAKGAPAVLAAALPLAHPRSAPHAQADFLELPRGGQLQPSGSSRAYDVVVCSMVVNCVPDPRDRYRMLLGLRAQLREGGLCFLTLPRTCLTHSCSVSEARGTRDPSAGAGPMAVT